MRIERIDTDEIVGLKCPNTGHHIVWNDENIADVLPGTVVSAVVSSLCPEECAVENLPLAAAWRQHYADVNLRKMSLDEVVEAFPAPGKALKIVRDAMTCGPMIDVAYYIIPEDLPDGCFIRAVGDADAV